MANYKIEISATAEKQLRKLKKQDQLRVLRTIRNLAQTPYPEGCRKLRRRYHLKELVSRMPKGFQVKETDWGPPVGKEVW